MSIYMGQNGLLYLERSAVGPGAQALATTLEPGDVVIVEKRFSADFPPSALINGDRIEIATQDGSNLQLVAGHNFPDGAWHCHVDQAGGIRLYTQFSDAIEGGKSKALPLIAPSVAQPIFIRNRDQQYNCLAQTIDWQLTTDREAVDITVLGENFRENYANGLISGQGEANAFWEYKYGPCDTSVDVSQELPNYYAQLLLRLEQGSLFKGRFYVYFSLTEPSVWYDADCVVTSVGFAFAPADAVRTKIQFVTTGEIKLNIGQVERYLLQQNFGLVLQENNGKLELQEPD